MIITNFAILFNMGLLNIALVLAVTNNNNYLNNNYLNSNYLRVRNFGLRLIIFREKNTNTFLDLIKNEYNKYYVKSMITLTEAISCYNNLSDDERLLIETVIALSY